MRALFFIHRYLGIAVGLLMVMWCLSGIIMMYVPYPQLTEESRLGHLAPIDWRPCCTIRGHAAPSEGTIEKVQLEMLGTALRRRTARHVADRNSSVASIMISGRCKVRAAPTGRYFISP